MDTLPLPENNSRIGFHYFPDSVHFRESDIQAWLPQLKKLGASWITLTAPSDRAIPEYFLKELVNANIEPILHFHPTLNAIPEPDDWKILFNTYAKWGINYCIFYEKPNIQTSWPAQLWAQEDLIEQFMDRYIPLADTAINSGLIPIFPPLQPGGDYWDTSFLRGALQSLVQRQKTKLINHLVFSAYAGTWNKPLTWGMGGPENWPGVKPYFTPATEEDQLGFRIFDWYSTLIRAELMETHPIILLGLGISGDPDNSLAVDIDRNQHTQLTSSLIHLLTENADGQSSQEKTEDGSIPPEIIAGNFWLLAASYDDPLNRYAWFQADGSTLPIVEETQKYLESQTSVKSVAKVQPVSQKSSDKNLPISHYLLLPKYEWGISDWHLDVIRPYIKKHQPTIGFSITEATYAQKVTIVGGTRTFTEEELNPLRNAGCIIERIDGDGTSIATQLAER